MLCPPAAATSRALLACSCPRTSEKSISPGQGLSRNSATSTLTACSSDEPLRKETTSERLPAANTLPPAASAASEAFAIGTTRPSPSSGLLQEAMGRTPRTGRSEPSSASSPT